MAIFLYFFFICILFVLLKNLTILNLTNSFFSWFQELAVRCIQRNVRAFFQVRDWQWWKLLVSFFHLIFREIFLELILTNLLCKFMDEFLTQIFLFPTAPNNSPIERPSHRRTIKIGDRWTRNAQSKIRKIRKWSECFENRKFKIRS